VNEPIHENRIRLILLDDQALFRASLGRLLASEPGLEVVGECGNSAEALEILSASPVDVVLLDFDRATEDGGGFMSVARRNGYQGRFLIVAGAADAQSSAIAIKLGASGVFLRSETPHRLVQAVTLVANGAVWLDQNTIRLLADQLVDRFPQLDDRASANLLTDREQKVLLGILAGLTNKQIAENLGLSEGSVKTSVQQLFYRTGVRTRSRLVRAALEGSLGTAKALTRRTRDSTAAVAPGS
jgi:DNA-binding NarL/FixJ family response regulator